MQRASRLPFTVSGGDGRRHGWGCIHAISAYQHKPPSNKPQPELRVQQCRGDRRGHGPSVATTASLGLRACSGPIARPTGRAHLSAGCAAPGRILPCPRFSGVGLPILGASSGEQLRLKPLAEGHLNRKLFAEMLRRIWALPCARRLTGDGLRRTRDAGLLKRELLGAVSAKSPPASWNTAIERHSATETGANGASIVRGERISCTRAAGLE